MAKIVLDKSGDLRKGVFYRFDIPFGDVPHGEAPTPEWFVVPRTPTGDALYAQNQEPWMWIAEAGDPDTAIQIKDCPLDRNHETHYYYTKFAGFAEGGKRVSFFVPTKNFCCFGICQDFLLRLEPLKIRGTRIDSIDLINENTGEKIKGFWALQFVGRIARRILKFVNVPNACPHCGKTKIFCEICGGDWNGTCKVCRKPTMVFDDQHGGPEDKRIQVERHRWGCIIEGKTWDGSDLVSSHGKSYASKRFIDWLLRIHAAPFYAEPVWFCVDGMSDQQKKWFDDLQKPFEA